MYVGYGQRKQEAIPWGREASLREENQRPSEDSNGINPQQTTKAYDFLQEEIVKKAYELSDLTGPQVFIWEVHMAYFSFS